jgi:hypothetical protein
MQLTMKKLKFVVALFTSVVSLGQDAAKPSLTPAQRTAIESANQQSLTAQYLSRIADLERQVANLQIRLTIAEACAGASIAISECEVKQDGTITKRDAPVEAKTPVAAAAAPAPTPSKP